MAKKLTYGGKTIDKPKHLLVEGTKQGFRVRTNYKFGKFGYTKNIRETITSNATLDDVVRLGYFVQGIIKDIETNNYDHKRYFPNSKNTNQIMGLGDVFDPRNNATVNNVIELLEQHWNLNGNSTKTNKADKSRLVHILNYFENGERIVRTITKTDCGSFANSMLGKVVPNSSPARFFKPKTVNNTLSMLRKVLFEAYERNIIKDDISKKIRNVKDNETITTKARTGNKNINPFTKDELIRIEAVEGFRRDIQLLTLFNCWCGLSPSELIALAWSDIVEKDIVVNENGVDIKKRVVTVNVQRARVEKEWRVTKELGRTRSIELSTMAIQYLNEIKMLSKLRPAITVSVVQRNNQSSIKEKIKPVFINSITGDYWVGNSLARRFKKLLIAADVPEREVNQMRKTFCSKFLTYGVPVDIIVRWMGHNDAVMIRKHYARFIHDDVAGKDAALMNSVLMANNK